MADDDTMKIHLEGKFYSIDDFEIAELQWLEDHVGATLDEMNHGSMKVAAGFVYIIKKRENPDFTLEDAGKVKLGAFGSPDEEPEVRPTKRAAKAQPAA